MVLLTTQLGVILRSDMRRFENLNSDEQMNAEIFVLKELRQNIKNGIIDFGVVPNEAELKQMAYWAASEARYDNDGNVVMGELYGKA